MKRYDHNYSVYYRSPDEDYPEGAAVDSTSEDNLDGTPLRADFMNDVIGFFQAAFHRAFGNPFEGKPVRNVSNEPETARKSDILDALETIADGKVDAEKEERGRAVAEEAAARSAAVKELQAAIDGILLRAHPVGSYYWSDFPTEPAVLFGGGTWERVKGRFILAADEKHSAGAEGGEDKVVLSESNLPRHRHPLGGKTESMDSNVEHTHTMTCRSADDGPNKDGRTNYGVTWNKRRSRRVTYTLDDADGISYKNEYWTASSAPVPLKANTDHKHGLPSHTDYTGSDTPESVGIMPPFRAAYCWRRTA